MEFASNGKGNLGVTLGAIGTGLSILNGGLGFWNGNNNNGSHFVTKDELDYVQTISSRDSEIALLKANAESEKKMIDIYERVMTRVNQNQRDQADWNAAQAVFNATSNSAIAVLQNQIGVLNGLTKTVIPNGSVCPGWGNVTVTPATTGSGAA